MPEGKKAAGTDWHGLEAQPLAAYPLVSTRPAEASGFPRLADCQRISLVAETACA